MASLALLPPFSSTAIPTSILPCEDGKLAEAAGELKSANPPNGSLDPPRNREKPKAVTGLCKDQLHVGFMKKSCSALDMMHLLILLPKSVLFSCSSPHYVYTSLSNNTLDYFQLPCRSCSFVFHGKNLNMQVFVTSKNKFRDIKRINKFLIGE